jgi:hypothetical protein
MTSSRTSLKRPLFVPIIAGPAWHSLPSQPVGRKRKTKTTMDGNACNRTERVLEPGAFCEAYAQEYTLILHRIATTKNSLAAPEAYGISYNSSIADVVCIIEPLVDMD